MCITLHLDGRGEGEGMSMEEGGCPNDVMNGSYWIWLIVNDSLVHSQESLPEESATALHEARAPDLSY